MPKLPDASQLGTRIPQNRGQVVSGNVDFSGYQQFGQQVENFGASIKDRQDAMNLQKAKTLFQKAKIQADNSFDQDNDFGTYAERYNEALTKAEQDAVKLVNSSRMQEMLKQDIALSRAQGIESIKDLAFQKETESGRATLDEILTTNRENALNATTEADRAAAIDLMNDAIGTAEMNSYIDADTAQAMRRKNGQDMAIGMVEMQGLKTQREMLSSGKGAAEIIPADVRKQMLENVDKRLVIEEGLIAADQIRAEGGNRSERLGKVREIKDPNARQAAMRQVEHDFQQEKLALAENQYDAYQGLAKEIIAGRSSASVVMENPQAWDSLTAEQQLKIQSLTQKNDKTDINTYNTLNQMLSGDRDVAYGYFLENAAKLSLSDQKKFSDRFAEPQKLQGYLSKSQRLTIKLEEAGISKDSDSHYRALQAMDEEFTQFEQENGRQPNSKETEQILDGVFDKVVDGSWNPFVADKYAFDLTRSQRQDLQKKGQLDRFETILSQIQSRLQEEAGDIPIVLTDEEINMYYRRAEQMGLFDLNDEDFSSQYGT
jgi:hypothetical protein